MSREDDALEAALQQAIQAVARHKGSALAQAIAPVIFANLDRGRIHYFLETHKNDVPEAYVWRVAVCYEQWQPYLYQVQTEQRADIWELLYEKLQRWAYRYLLRKGFAQSGNERFQHAVECATTAAIQLLHARFPYDVDFDPWVSVLLQNVVNKHVEREHREAPENSANDPNWENWQNLLPVSSTPEDTDLVELRQDLLNAIGQLASEARKQVILLHYFEGYPFPQIAATMGKSENAVHKLHFDALNNLRKIWDGLQDKYE